MCVPFNRIFGDFRFRIVNIVWLHLLGFAFICLSCNHFSIFAICSCSNVTVVSGSVCLTSIAVSSPNVSILLYVSSFAEFGPFWGYKLCPCAFFIACDKTKPSG